MARPRKPRFDKKCKMCDNTFEVIVGSIGKTYCSKKCSNSDPDIKEKNRVGVKRTFDKKYGKHPMLTDKTKERHSKTMLSKYGVKHALQRTDFFDKAKKTRLDRYGDENYNNIDKALSTKLDRYGSSTYRNVEQVQDNIYNELLNLNNVELLFSRDEYVGVDGIWYDFKCCICDSKFTYNIDNGNRPKCSCQYSVKYRSNIEDEIYDFLKNECGVVNIILNDRQVIKSELDIYLPDYKLAIEVDGLYWHSEQLGKDSTYHITKTNKCKDVGIQLLHIYDTEWNNKTEIIKSMLKSKLNITSKIYARKCEIRDNIDVIEFLNSNHLQGSDNSSKQVGLYYEDELVSVLTFGKPRFDKTLDYELYRYCTKINTTVIGGFSKMLKYFIKNNPTESILTYSDMRYSVGDVYIKNGFEFISNTPPSYFYMKNGTVYSRYKCQKHKLNKLLDNFDSDKTEFENMDINGFLRIWNCGNKKFVFSRKK